MKMTTKSALEDPAKKNNPMQSKQPHALPARYGKPDAPTHPDTGQRICASYTRGGKLNRFGDPVCLSNPVAGRKRCRMHGGTSPRGIASPNYQGKGYSKDMPTRLLGNFVAAVNDPQLFNLTNQAALLEARMLELIGTLDTGEAGSIWKTLQASADALEQARQDGIAATRNGDSQGQAWANAALAAALNDLLKQIKRGAAEHDRWREIYDLAERKRRLTETMRKIKRDAKKFVSATDMILMMHRIADVIHQNVSDKPTLARIASGLAQIVNNTGAKDVD